VITTIALAIVFASPAPPAQAQHDLGDCEVNGSVSTERPFNWSSTDIVCLSMDTLDVMNVSLSVRSGSVDLFYTQDINASFNPRGHYVSSSRAVPFSLVRIEAQTMNTPTLMVVPVGQTEVRLEFERVEAPVTAQPECNPANQNCGGYIPSALDPVPVMLDHTGDRTRLFVDVCPGEFQVTVRGMPQRNDVYVHIYPLGGTVPAIGDPPNVARASNVPGYYFVAWQTISSNQARSNPVWVVYVTRNGYDASRTLNLTVGIELICGRTTLENARPPQNAFRTNPRSGATLLPGGVSVGSYCNAYDMVARNVNNQYWVCFDPDTLRFATIEPGQFDTMCRQQHGYNDAYGVKPQSGAGGLECYR
jgi:hypothetical protein